MQKTLETASLSDYHPEIGRWLWAMEEVRRRALDLVRGMDRATLDWQGPHGDENAIGSLLYHIGLVEMSWLFMDILEQDLPQSVKADFPYPMATEGRITPVLMVEHEAHVGRLNRSRRLFLDTFKGMSFADWERLRAPENTDYRVTPAWAVFHLVEHEAGHAAQISSLKVRAREHMT